MRMFNNGFPVGYQPYVLPQVPQYPQMQAQQAQQTQQVMNWVHGKGEADAFPVAPNTTVPLYDADSPVIYWKSADSSGRPSVRILDYKVREAQEVPPEAKVAYATKDDLDALKGQIESLKMRIGKMNKKEAPADE